MVARRYWSRPSTLLRASVALALPGFATGWACLNGGFSWTVTGWIWALWYSGVLAGQVLYGWLVHEVEGFAEDAGKTTAEIRILGRRAAAKWPDHQGAKAAQPVATPASAPISNPTGRAQSCTAGRSGS